MTDYRHAIIIIFVMGFVTLATRVVPALIFERGRKVPDYIAYLGKVAPYAAMGMLIVYCLRDASFMESPHAAPELIALAVVSGSYLWKRNAILSVAVGTAAYMFLVQSVF